MARYIRRCPMTMMILMLVVMVMGGKTERWCLVVCLEKMGRPWGEVVAELIFFFFVRFVWA